MNAIGIDIGSTTLSAVVLDEETGSLLAVRNVQNCPALPQDLPGASLYDADRLTNQAIALVEELENSFGPVRSIGIDGQMHGMLYVNAEGHAVSPFYTWQDRRGDLPLEDSTYVGVLGRLSGYAMATGYGFSTLFWQHRNNCVPSDAASMCTIYDYVAMRLANRSTPLMHASSAASFGMFNTKKLCWDTDAFARAGLEKYSYLLPEVTSAQDILGTRANGAIVGCAIGDNQASFLGAVQDMQHTVLVNVGTGSQVSMLAYGDQCPLDTDRRPLFGNSAIFAGSPLCGGRSYALLASLLRESAALVENAALSSTSSSSPSSTSSLSSSSHASPSSSALYEMMNQIAMKAIEQDQIWKVDTRFSGSRRQPSIRGSMQCIGVDTFDIAHMIGGTVWGIAEELYNLYQSMLSVGTAPATVLVGSGNAIRRNPALCLAFEKLFSLPLQIPTHMEEAAFGAALFALSCSGKLTIEQAQSLIRYNTSSSSSCTAL